MKATVYDAFFVTLFKNLRFHLSILGSVYTDAVSFVGNRIFFDPVTPSVYTATME